MSASSGKRPANYTIIVRLWPEKGDGDQVMWRGSIDCVQTEEHAYFQTLPGLVERIAQIIGETPPGQNQ